LSRTHIAKSGSRMEQANRPGSYSEAKTLVKRQYKTLWTNQTQPAI
jgi:hypothetical protein